VNADGALVVARPFFAQNGRPAVSFRFNATGARKFGNYTAENIGQLFAIVLDDEVISAPQIKSHIAGGSGIITGSFTVEESTELAVLLRAGALPAKMTFLEERTIGPELGQDSIEAGQRAAGIGMVAVVGFMIASMGVRFAYRAVRELVDTGLDPEEVARIAEAIRTTPGVEDLHQIRTRRMADRILLDAHIQVAPRLSVSEGHRVADLVFARLKERFPHLDDALIHVDHENDMTRPPGQMQALTDRTELVQELRALPAFAAATPDWIILHYQGGRTHLDLQIPAEQAPFLLAADRTALFSQLESLRQRHPDLATIRLFVEIAPEKCITKAESHESSA